MFLAKKEQALFEQLTPEQQENALKFREFLESAWLNLIAGALIGATVTYVGLVLF